MFLLFSFSPSFQFFCPLDFIQDFFRKTKLGLSKPNTPLKIILYQNYSPHWSIVMPGKFQFISKHIQNFVLKPQFQDFFRKPIFEISDLTVVSLKESRFLLGLTCKTDFQQHFLKPHVTSVPTMYDTMGQLETKCQSNCS